MRALIHIGIEKTGSTAIQEALRQSCSDLRNAGFLYLAGEVPRYRWGLSIYAAPLPQLIDLLSTLELKDHHGLSEYRRDFADYVSDSVKSNPDHTFVFSEEHCHSRITTKESVERLRDFLREFFDEIQIFIYLRRQDRLASSYYSSRLFGGKYDENPLLDAGAAYFDFRSILNLWSDAFGKDRIHVAIYDEVRRTGRSIIENFSRFTGIPLSDRSNGVLTNQSISNAARSVLLHLNARQDDEKELSHAARMLVYRVYSETEGDVFRPTRSKAREFYDSFFETNDWVRKNYFPDLDQLFDDDFDDYPEHEIEVHACAALDIAMAALSHAARDCIDARAALAKTHTELCYYRGLVHLDAWRLAEAQASVDEGLATSPGHSELWNLRGRLLLAQGNPAMACRALDRALEIDPDNIGHVVTRDRIVKAASRGRRWSSVTRLWRSARHRAHA